MSIRIGILGMGNIGMTHAQAIAALEDEDVELAAYSASSPVKVAEGASVRRLTPGELIAADDIDLIVVATPSELHAQHTIAAMQAGKGIVVEKPLATTASDARAVVATWRETGTFGATISQRRLEPQHQYIKNLLDQGELGRPLLGEAVIHWWRDEAYYAAASWRAAAPGGGALMNQALHNIDLLVWLLGPAAEVGGFTATNTHGIAAEDTAAAVVRFHSGAFGAVVASTATPPGRPARLTLHTSTGFVELDHTTVVHWEFPGVPSPGDVEELGSGAADPSAIGHAGHLAQWRDIVDAYRSGRDPSITIADGLSAVELIDAIHRSSEEGVIVRLELP